MANETFTSEVVIVDKASDAAERIATQLERLRKAGEDVVTVEEKRDRAAGAALRRFEALEKRQNALARAEQRRAQQLRDIERAQNQTGLGRTEDGLRRLERATKLANEAFEETRRRLDGNVTAYERFRNSLDPITQAQRRFAEGQEIISAALRTGEIDLKENADVLERLRARLDDQRRSAQFAADDYAQLSQRLNPVIAAEREFAIALSTVNDALQRGRIDAGQAKEDISQLRAELEKSRDAANNQRTAYQQLVESIDPIARAEREHAEALKIVDAATKSGDATDQEAIRVKKILEQRLEDVTKAARENASAFQLLVNEINPIARAEQDLAAKLEIVDKALAKGEVSEREAIAVKDQLRARVDALKLSIEQQATAYQKIQARIDPVSAAERQLKKDLEDLRRATESGEIGFEEQARAAALLQKEFDALKAKTSQTKNEFRDLELRIDRVARAQEEFARDSKIVSTALNKQEISAERAAGAMRILEDRYRRASTAGDRFNDSVGGLHRGIGRLNIALSAGGGIVAAFFGSFVVRELVQFNDTLQQSENRLRIVTDSFGQLAVTQDDLFKSSQESFTAIIGGVEIYERLARSTRSLGIENQRLLNVTEAIQKSVALSGTTALAANAALIQFGQGLAADSLRGQELNSVMEQTPRLARALAEGLGIGIGQLRELANQGELTAEKVIKAIESQADAIDREFATIEPTIQQVSTSFVNSATVIGDAFSKPIFDRVKEGIKSLQEELDSEESRRSAEAFGQNIAAGLDASIGFFVGIRDVIGIATNSVSQFLAKTADAAKEISEQETKTPAGRIIQAIVRAQLEAIPVGGRYFKTLGDIRAEQAKLARQEELEKQLFKQQEAWEAIGKLVGASAAQVKQVRQELGLLGSDTKDLPTDPLERFEAAIAGISESLSKLNGAGGETVLEKAKNEAQAFADALKNAKAAADSLAGVAFSNIAGLFKGDDAEAFNAAIKRLEERATDLREKKAPINSNKAAEIISFFESNFPQTFADDEQRKRIEDFANEIERLSGKTKDASDNFLELALRARELTDLKLLADAAIGGPEALEAAKQEIELQKELLSLEAKAREDGEKFDRAAEESRLRQMQTLERQIEAALEAYDVLERKQERARAQVIEGVNRDVGQITSGAGNDRRFSSASDLQRQQALEQALARLSLRREQFNEVDSIGLSQEQIEEMDQVFDDAARELRRIFVVDGPAAFEERIRAASEDLVGSILEDILFNKGKGLGDIFKSIQQQTVSNVIIDPVSKFLSGQSEDLFGDISAALKENSEKFSRIGGQLGKVFGDEAIGKAIGKEVGGAINNFAIGNTISGLFGDSKAGNIGAAAGAVVGQIAELATGIPFLGEAIGALGGLIGGLFGRKTATGTFDFSTGNIDLDNSKKDSRNQERDVVLEQSIQAVQALAQALGGSLRVGTGLEVNVKKSIRTDIVDPKTGRIIQSGGSVGRGDIAGAVSNVIDAALNSVIQGGDERLTKIAKTFAGVDLPAEKLVTAISNLGQVFDYIDGPASQFSEVLDQVVKIFDEATAAAGAYGAATKAIADQQLETLKALGGKFDDDTAKATRRLTDPVLQDALDLADDQLKRLQDAQKLNQEIIDAAKAASSAQTGFQSIFGVGDIFGGRGFGSLGFGRSPQFAAAAPTDTAAVLDAQADAQRRLTEVAKLATEEFKAFIRNSGSTPETFRAVALAIEDLRSQAAGLGVDFATLTSELENVRQGIAAEFDDSEAKRRLRLENPLAVQVGDIVDAQVEIIASARAIGGSQEELQARLSRVYSTNALELEKFIEAAASAPDAISEVVDALLSLRDRAEEIGVSLQEIDQIGAGAIIGAGDAFLESINKDFLKFTNDPLSRLVDILEAEQKLVDTAKKFAELNPARFGGLPGIVQQRNALEREKFLESLSDEEKLRLGDFIGLIEDYGGRIAVVSSQLRDTLKKNTEDLEKEIDRLNDVFENAIERADRIAETRQSILDRFFPGTPLDQFRDTQNRLEEAFQKGLAGDDKAVDQAIALASQFVDQAANVFGGDDRLAAARDRAVEILDLLEAADRQTATDAERQIEILEADLKTSENILKSLESAQDNTLYLQMIVDNGVLQNKLLQDQIEELLRLRALQSGQNINAVNNLAAIDSPDSVLAAFRTSSPDFSNVDLSALTTLVQSASLGAVPNFSFAQSSIDVASQIAELMALARQSAPIQAGQAVPTQSTSTPSQQSSTDIILALGALDQTFSRSMTAMIEAINSLKEELRVLRNDNQRLNNELKSAYRATTL